MAPILGSLKTRSTQTLLLWFASYFLAGSGAFAGELKWTYFGLRPLGMGNAFVSIVDDHNALFYNPAGLARLKEWDGEIFNPRLGISKNTTTFINDALDLAGGDGDSYDAVIDLLRSQAGKSQYLAFGFAPHLIFKGFGFGFGTELEGSMAFHRYPTVELNVGPRLIAPIAFATNFFEDRLSVGVSIKARMLGGINHELSIQDLDRLSSNETDTAQGSTSTTSSTSSANDFSDIIEGGAGFGADVGLLFTPVKEMSPTFGMSITDVGGTSYSKLDFGGTAISTPKPALASVNLGMSFKPYQKGSHSLLLATDMHAINQPVHFSKKWNFGAEWAIGSIFKTQLGLHQGYATMGLEIDVGLLNARISSYAAELGPVAGTIEDRRYLMQLKLLL